MLSKFLNSQSDRLGSAPAWLMSLATHAVFLIILALVLPRPTRPAVGESDRDVGIVLTTRGDQDRPTYTDETDVADSQAERATDSNSTAEQTDDTQSLHAALPAAADHSDLLLRDIQLPGRGLPTGARGDLLVPKLTLDGSGRKPILPGMDEEFILAERSARQAARDALGPSTGVSIFGSEPATGRSFVFAIDRSKSMGGDGLNALAAARTELSRSLAHLTPKHRFQIIAYHHQCVYFNTPRLVSATEENRQAISRFIDELGAFGGTDHEMALRAALAMEPDVVFLLNDGGDPHLGEIALKNIHKLAEGRSTISCVQFGFGPLADRDSFMMRLARQNGGSFTYVDMSVRRSHP